MTDYNPGDEIRVDISEPSDPDHRYHGEVGTVVAVNVDGLGELTGDPNDNYIYTVAFTNEKLGTMDFRHQDLDSNQ